MLRFKDTERPVECKAKWKAMQRGDVEVDMKMRAQSSAGEGHRGSYAS